MYQTVDGREREFDDSFDPYTAGGMPPTAFTPRNDPRPATDSTGPISPNTPLGPAVNHPGYRDLQWWKREHGITPDRIFDSNGQILPGWTRTANGYERSGGPPPGTSNTAGSGQSSSVAGSGGYTPPAGSGGNLGGMFSNLSAGSAPRLDFPGYESPGEFSFDPYKQSSWGDAENEPGYAASRKQLRQQIEAGAAHRGVLRSGMTVGDLYTNLDALGQQNFKQFDDRQFRNWSGNRDLAATAFGFKAQDVDRKNNYQFNVADSSFKDALSRWQTMVGSLTTLARPVE